MRKQNLEGKRFGRLVVVRALPPTIKGERYRWECHCDCGNTTYVQTYNLTSQNTTSCGCVRKEKAAKDIRNQRFGRLVALRPTSKRSKKRSVIWLCQCDCGTQVEIDYNRLLFPRRRDDIQSCGCLAQENRTTAITIGRKKLADNELVDNTMLCRLTAKTPTSNTSGRKGVHFDKRRGKWVARITLQQKSHYLGTYNNFEDAVKARERAEEELFEPVLNAHGRTLYPEEHNGIH